jgi:putative membrane protein
MTSRARMVRRCAVTVAAAVVVLVSGAGVAAAATTVSGQDRAYVMGAHQSNLAEIAAGKLAQSKGSSKEVKDLGTMLVTDHTKLDAALRKVATAAGASLPAAPNAEQKAMQAKLMNASADEFDAMFVAGQITGHAKAMALGEKEMKHGSDAAVMKAATDAAPVIARHHDKFMAQARAMGLPDHVGAGRVPAVASQLRGGAGSDVLVSGRDAAEPIA